MKLTKITNNLIPENHHAFLVAGDFVVTWPVMKKIIEAELLAGREFFTCPDAWLVEESSAGIELARKLKNFSNYRSIEIPAKILVTKVNFMTVEAQNALLKTLEEPIGESQIFILASSREIFLPTVLSRLAEIRLPEGPAGEQTLAKKFLSATPAGRFQILEKQFSGERHEDKEVILKLLSDLENIFTKMPPAEKAQAIQNGWDQLPQIRQMLFVDHGSPKQVGELLASVL